MTLDDFTLCVAIAFGFIILFGFVTLVGDVMRACVLENGVLPRLRPPKNQAPRRHSSRRATAAAAAANKQREPNEQR